MDWHIRLSHIKSTTLKKIEKAAIKGNTSSLVSNTKIIEEIESLEKRFNDLIASLTLIEKAANNNSDNSDSFVLNRNQHETIPSRKKIGEKMRTAFLKRLQNLGLNVTQVKGVKYKVSNRALIGIAYAFENRSNRWFLGLPKENFTTVVLLCESKNGTILNFILSSDFYDKIENYLSTDENNQVKFNIALRNNDYQLIVPQLGNENINAYIDNFNNIISL